MWDFSTKRRRCIRRIRDLDSCYEFVHWYCQAVRVVRTPSRTRHRNQMSRFAWLGGLAQPEWLPGWWCYFSIFFPNLIAILFWSPVEMRSQLTKIFLDMLKLPASFRICCATDIFSEFATNPPTFLPDDVHHLTAMFTYLLLIRRGNKQYTLLNFWLPQVSEFQVWSQADSDADIGSDHLRSPFFKQIRSTWCQLGQVESQSLVATFSALETSQKWIKNGRPVWKHTFFPFWLLKSSP